MDAMSKDALSGSNPDPRCHLIILFMKNLVEYVIPGHDRPVAFISEDLPDYIKQIIRTNWDYTTSGLSDSYSISDRD